MTYNMVISAVLAFSCFSLNTMQQAGQLTKISEKDQQEIKHITDLHIFYDSVVVNNTSAGSPGNEGIQFEAEEPVTTVLDETKMQQFLQTNRTLFSAGTTLETQSLVTKAAKNSDAQINSAEQKVQEQRLLAVKNRLYSRVQCLTCFCIATAAFSRFFSTLCEENYR